MDEEGRRRLAALASVLGPVVTAIEARGPTPGGYAALLTALIRRLDRAPPPGFHLFLALALIRAGANRAMVHEALRLLGKPPRDERTIIRACPPDRRPRP